MTTPMESRTLGRTGRAVSVIGQGCWQFGGDWGDVGDDQALDILRAGADAGVTFFDTADVYGDGRSEQLVGRFIAERNDPSIMVATKMGRRANPHVADAYNRDNFRAWNDRSRENLGVDTLDLVQLHCPPSEVYSTDQVYDWLDEMVDEGRMKAYGVSVETVDEAVIAMRHEHVASIQIIFNIFRRKPLEAVLPMAAEKGVGIIARVPLASGLLSGKFTAKTVFAPEDHRTYNRHGEAFDQGETFSGVPYEVGTRGRRPAPRSRAGRRHDGPVRAALDHRPTGSEHGHPGREQGEPGRGQRGRSLAQTADRRAAGCLPQGLRQPHPRARARAVVSFRRG